MTPETEGAAGDAAVNDFEAAPERRPDPAPQAAGDPVTAGSDAEERPDLVILGDSHAIALRQGAALAGLPVLGLNFSGNFWHAGRFRYGRNGFEVLHLPSIQAELVKQRDRIGGACLFAAGVPVLLSAGYHLGRLVPPFGWNGHAAAPEAGRWPDNPQVASTDLATDYVNHFRQRHFRVIGQVNRRSRVIVIAPPICFDRPNYATFRAIITDRLRAMKVEVYDPAADFTAPGETVMDAKWIAPDGLHGTAEYGIQVLKNLAARGLIAPRTTL